MPPCLEDETKKSEEAGKTAWRRDSLRVRLTPARSIEETGLDPSVYGGFSSPHATPSPGKTFGRKTSMFKSQTETPMDKDGHSAKTSGVPPAYSSCQDHPSQKTQALFENAFNLTPVEEKGDLDTGLQKHEDTSSSAYDNDLKGQLKETVVVQSKEDMFGTGMISESDLEEASVLENEADKDQNLIGFVDTPRVTTVADQAQLECSSPKIAKGVCLSETNLCSDEANSAVVQASIAPLENSNGDSVVPLEITEASDSHNRALRENVNISTANKIDARARWKRITHTVTLVNHMAANLRSASTDLLEVRAVDELVKQQGIQDDAGGVGAAAFEGAKTAARSRSRGRKGMEGLLVRQDRGVASFFQDFYVACLKMPIVHFLSAVFLAPVALGLLFTPLYLLDVDGLYFDGIVPEDATTSPLVSAKQRCLAFLNIFLYALSLSTTFGGSPVTARSPFTLLVANVNTLLAQFLFVFLSGAVFARMSQPSYPIRCSKKAVIKTDDLLPVLGLEQQEKFKAFAVRLVLTGPPPCELVDVKISLTFRLFVKLPSGSVFCSTQDLEVVRPEVSYLRYGLMVRHIIDKKSPVYGHTMESLREGDASFSLTVMGMERTSMQQVFHLEDYFVCDNDVVWEGDYIDFIHINEKGQRVLDHSQIDLLKPMKAVGMASQAVTRMKNLSQQRYKEQVSDDIQMETIKHPTPAPANGSLKSWLGGMSFRKRKLLKSKSTSFTRADW